MYRYNWIPSLRKHHFDRFAFNGEKLAHLPSRVDLRGVMSPIVDQKDEGSCTANAIVSGMIEFLELRHSVHDNFGKTFKRLSRNMFYYCEREEEGDVNQDSGAAIPDGIKVAMEIGVCTEDLWPYEKSNMFTKPSVEAYEEAKKHKNTKAMTLNTIHEMKTCLAAGFPFVTGIPIFTSFESTHTIKTGIVPFPKSHERLLGGHCVCLVGYEDKEDWFIMRNSWGTGVGDQGYFYLSTRYMEQLAQESTTIRK